MAVAAAATAQNLLTISRSHLCFYSVNRYSHGDPLRNPFFTLPNSFKNGGTSFHFNILGHRDQCKLEFFKNGRWRLRIFKSDWTVQRDGSDKLNFDTILSIAEVLCLAPSAVLSIAFSVNWAFFNSQKSLFQLSLVNRVFMWQFVLLLSSVAIGALIRRRQWKRICKDSFKSDGSSFNLVERIEKLEEDLRNSVTIIRVLSRQLEKLGIRFRVTRKALKDPITETAALAQKNSEATRALAMQEDILEKELREIQKVLLAMQDQQRKQLELIVAIGKAGKLRESKKETVTEKDISIPGRSVEEIKQKETQIHTGVRHKGDGNDKA